MRLLTGIQPSGRPHIGNYLGVMKTQIEYQASDNQCFYFLVDLHALTTVRNPEALRQMTIDMAIDYLALGLDPEKENIAFYKQSDLPEHCELAWILDCITPFALLERGHAWKDAKQKRLKDPTVGLFNYPVLMAADILLYQPDFVPVGQDQKQHLEITRDLAIKFNNTYGETFKVPEVKISKETGKIMGTDGENKMSKSYGNTISIFAEPEVLKKQVMGIKTDSKGLDEPKDPETDIVFSYYKFFASEKEIENLKDKYLAGGYGYGDAKKLLLEKIQEHFEPYRKKRIELENNLDYIEEVFKKGAAKAKETAQETLNTVKKRIGLI